MDNTGEVMLVSDSFWSASTHFRSSSLLDLSILTGSIAEARLLHYIENKDLGEMSFGDRF